MNILREVSQETIRNNEVNTQSQGRHNLFGQNVGIPVYAMIRKQS